MYNLIIISDRKYNICMYINSDYQGEFKEFKLSQYQILNILNQK